jgi:hypothetical protein
MGAFFFVKTLYNLHLEIYEKALLGTGRPLTIACHMKKRLHPCSVGRHS